MSKLLLVDDDPRNVVLLERLLLPLGHELLRAHDGPTAIELFNRHSPDLVLLDMAMPGMDGLGVLARIRSDVGAGAYTPVILVTAHSEREARRAAVEAGADEFLEKPADGPILRARVRTLLQLKESRDALRHLNEELASRNADLERLQRHQRELMAFVVHDLKNPLSVIGSNLTFARSVLRGPPEAGEALDDASTASQRLRAMIEDLLSLLRLEQSGLPLQLEAVSPAEVLKQVLRDYRLRAEEKHVELSNHRDDEARVTADRALLRRVIENIVDNSLRYTPEHGRVELAMRANGHVEIAVSNTGPSIPPTDRERIFEKFTELGTDLSEQGHIGLGLYFCKRVVELLGGQIEVTETPEWPTSFIVRLPAARKA